MQYFYHHVPKNMVGTILYPLNELKSKYPDMYEEQHSKYNGREHVTRQRIPLLDDCLWNDVIFMTTLNPQKLFDARIDAGWDKIEPQLYFKIDSSTLDQDKLAVYLFKFKESNIERLVSDEEFVKYNQNDADKYAEIPQATKDYFKFERENGEPNIKLFYRYIPHILYKGSIDISNAEIITVG